MANFACMHMEDGAHVPTRTVRVPSTMQVEDDVRIRSGFRCGDIRTGTRHNPFGRVRMQASTDIRALSTGATRVDERHALLARHLHWNASDVLRYSVDIPVLGSSLAVDLERGLSRFGVCQHAMDDLGFRRHQVQMAVVVLAAVLSCPPLSLHLPKDYTEHGVEHQPQH